MLSFSRKYRAWISILTLIAVIAYGLTLTSPNIFGDEWGLLYANSQGKTVCLDFSVPRPLGECPYFVILHLFGANMIAYKMFALVMILCSSILLLVLMEMILPEQPVLNFSIAALFLVYPTVWMKSTWFGIIELSLVVILLSALFLARFLKNGAWGNYWAGLGLLVFSFLFYEIAIGLAMCFPLIALFNAKKMTPTKRWAVWAPMVIAVGFSIWKALVQLQLGTAYGHRVEDIAFSPQTLVSRFLLGARINFQWGWTSSLIRLFPGLEAAGQAKNLGASILFYGGILVILVLGTFFAKKWSRLQLSDPENIDNRKSPLRQYLLLFFAGLLLTIAAYIPVILVEIPGLRFAESRLNLLPSIGAAITTCAALAFLIVFMGNQQPSLNPLLLSFVVPLILLGTFRQVQVQQETIHSWGVQKSVWRQLLTLAPDLAPGTIIFLQTPQYDPINGARPFESGTVGLSGALSLLYGHWLQGFLAYPDTPVSYLEQGFVHPIKNEVIPYEKVIYLSLSTDGSLHLENRLPVVLEGHPSNLFCQNCILDQGKASPYRKLLK